MSEVIAGLISAVIQIAVILMVLERVVAMFIDAAEIVGSSTLG